MSVLQQGLQRYFSAAQLSFLGRMKVGIAGAGGLGSNCAAFLARSGVRRFILADFDVVEASNLNRQWYYPDDVGKPKVECLAQHLRRLEPELELTVYQLRLTAQTVAQYFAGCDALVEAFDDPAAKAMFVNAALPLSPLLVSASGLAGAGGKPMGVRRVNSRFVIVGDGESEVSAAAPPLAPRVMQAAGLQADVVLAFFLQEAANASSS